MVLENVKEMWTETPRKADGKKGRPVNKDRFISKMYVSPLGVVWGKGRGGLWGLWANIYMMAVVGF